MSTKGFTKYDISKILPLIDAIRDFNPENANEDTIAAEITLYRGGAEIAIITNAEGGGGVRLISKESIDV